MEKRPLVSLTTPVPVGIATNTAALLMDDRFALDERSFVELVAWRRDDGSHKYRFAYVVDEVCMLRYDNEAGKGDHRHLGNRETPYRFTTIDDLLIDFWTDVGELRK